MGCVGIRMIEVIFSETMDSDLDSSSNALKSSASSASLSMDISTIAPLAADVQPSSAVDSSVEEILLPLLLRQFSYADIKLDLFKCMILSSRLGFFQSQKWAAELLKPMEKIKCRMELVNDPHDPEATFFASFPFHFAIQNAMHRYQYGEAMFYAKQQQDRFKEFPVLKFLYYYNRYLHGQSQWIQTCEDPLVLAPISENDARYLQSLREELKQEMLAGDFDPLMKYLYGVILRQLGLYELASDCLIGAISEEPRLWCFWFELADCVMSKEQLDRIIPQLKQHWMRDFFLGRVYSLLNLTEEAYGTYKYIRNKTLFSSCSYVLVEYAKICYARSELTECIKIIERVRKDEPGRLDDMGFYSNALYRRGDKSRLARLCRELHDVDPFSSETHMVIANYCSFRDQQDKAIEHLALALRTYPTMPLAHLLLGLTYVAVKNLPRAVAAFNKAVELNPRDFKAWFGLGQVHETEKPGSQQDKQQQYARACLYYQRSCREAEYECRPWNALGDVYMKMDNKTEDASRAYWKCFQNGDKEEMAILKLARIYVDKGDPRRASRAYRRYFESCEDLVSRNREEFGRAGYTASVGEAYVYVAEDCLQTKQFMEARTLAMKAAAVVSAPGVDKTLTERMDKVLGATTKIPQDEKDSQVIDGSAMELSISELDASSLSPNKQVDSLISDDEENLPSMSSS